MCNNGSNQFDLLFTKAVKLINSASKQLLQHEERQPTKWKWKSATGSQEASEGLGFDDSGLQSTSKLTQ